MNAGLLRHVYPLELRQWLYFKTVKTSDCPEAGPFPLEFAPVALAALKSTDCGHKQIQYTGFYELQLSRMICRLAQKGGVLLDVGANVGYFSCLWAAINSRNRSLAFEASPRIAPMLKENVEKSGLANRVTISSLAMGQEAGTMLFDPGPEEQSGWGGLVQGGGPKCVEVEVMRLDEVCADVGEVSVLKIDTEGADAWVLFGAEKLLKQRRVHHVFYENNYERMQALGIEPDDTATFLRRLGYRVEKLDRHGSEWHAYPV